LVPDPTAKADDALREDRPGDHPAGDVHLVHALVADVAVAEVPEPVPAVVHQVLVIRLRRGRAQPDVEVEVAWRGFFGPEADIATRTLSAPAILVHQAAGDQELAVFARFGQFGQRLPRPGAATLRAVLHDAVVLAGRLDCDCPLVHVVAGRLLDVDVLAGLAGPDGHQRVPVVRGGDGNCVEFLVIERLADVLDALRPIGLPLEPPHVFAVCSLVRVNQVGQLHAGDGRPGADVAAAAAVQAGDADADGLVSTEDAG